MRNFIASDLHFGHKNIMNFSAETRPYTDVDHMNESMVEEWNSIVTPEDHTYILGDVAFMKPAKAASYVNRLNGTKTLVIGNHDHKNIRSEVFASCFVEMHHYLEIKVNDHLIVMCHYPIFEWNALHRGSLHFHGHTHGAKTGIEGRIADVGMDAVGRVVVPLDEMIEIVAAKEIRSRSK